MRFGVILFGILVGAAGYFIGGTVGIVGIALGVLLFLVGIFLKKKGKAVAQAGYNTGKQGIPPERKVEVKRAPNTEMIKNIKTVRGLRELRPAR